MRVGVRFGWLGLIGALGACRAALPSPPLTEHSSSDYHEVPFPPPAALPEVIPKAPRGESVWVDGEWVFRGHGYVWEHGGWVAAPRDASFAPWAFVFAEDGRLLYAPGTWYDALGRKLVRPKPVIYALTPENTLGAE